MKIRSKTNIKRIKIGDTEFNFSQYAGNSSVIIDGSKHPLNET